MPKWLQYPLIAFGMAFVNHSCFPMVYDNRFIPLFDKPQLLIDGKESSASGDFFVITASKAIDSNENEIGIPELFGTFDQGRLAELFIDLGLGVLLPSEWLGARIPWHVNGKIQGRGFAFTYEQLVVNHFSLGFSWFFLRSDTSLNFILKNQETDVIDRITLPSTSSINDELDDIRRHMFDRLGLSNHARQTGPGDVDLYIRLSNHWDYTLRFRRIDASLRAGILVPTGVQKKIDNPASIPFGGNGHWGYYIGADALFELKEDLKFGVSTRISKRLPRTTIQRLSINGEPQIFSPLVGPVRVDPGITFVFSPYCALENLRGGLGLCIQYTLTKHGEDEWSDRRAEPRAINSDLKEIVRLSEWSSDYVTLNVFYDFGKVKTKRGFDPILFARWDIPALLFVASRVPRTHRISLGIEFVF